MKNSSLNVEDYFLTKTCTANDSDKYIFAQLAARLPASGIDSLSHMYRRMEIMSPRGSFLQPSKFYYNIETPSHRCRTFFSYPAKNRHGLEYCGSWRRTPRGRSEEVDECRGFNSSTKKDQNEAVINCLSIAKTTLEQRKTRPLPLLHKQQLAPFTSPGKIIQKTRNPTTHSTASGVNSPFAGKGPNPVPKITAEYEGLVGTKLQVPANKDFASEPRIPDLPLPELNYFKVEEDKAEIECPMLNIRLCDGKNNELASVKFPKKIRSPKNTETFAVLQQYLEKMLNESAEKHSLQRSLVSSPREVANNKKGNETQIAFMDNQMIIQGKSSNAKTKNLSLTRLLLSQQCFPELDHKSPQHPAVATGFEKKLDVTNKQPSNLQDFINISGLDIKTRPKEMRKLVYNISRKSVKYDGHKAVEPRLKAQILSGIGEEAKDLVEMVMDPKGDVIIRPKEREKHVPKRMHLMNQRALHTKKLNRRQASQCVYRMPKIVQKVQEPAVIVSSLATPPITQVTKGKVIATPRQACRKQQHLVSVSPLRKVSHDSLEEKKNESAKVTPQKVKVKFTKKKVKDPEVVHSDQRAQALVNITALNEVHIIQYTSNKEPSKIKIIHTDYTHHSNHIINKTLNGLNQFISATFRNKDNYLDSKLISKLSKAFCLQLPVGKNAITAQGFKNKDLANPIKERLLKSLFYIINSDNEIPLSLCPLKTPQYRFYISTGNNGVMVRSILKQRWWWTYGKKSDENLNLLWTQWSKKSFIQALPSKKQRSTTDIWKEERKSDTSTLTGNISIESEGDTTASKQTPRASKIAKTMQISSSSTVKMCNHLENHYHLSNKKAMFFNMNQYYLAMKKDPFDTLPLTFHIRSGVEDVEFQKFSVYYQNLENVLKAHLAEKNEKHGEGGVAADKGKPVVEKNIWIIKPGENSNRGYGIQVLREFEEIKKAISGSCTHNGEKEAATGNRTFIIQKYIERPLLIYKRKFDIRMFGLITSVNGFLKGYYYEEGYLRTSSKEYTLKNLTKKTIHLTNDAVQNRAEDYGKYETGNKLSFFDFQKYLDLSYGSLHIDFYRDILPQIKKIITDTFRAVYTIIDPFKRTHTFEIFGYDFMIDCNFKVYLIEVNTNPCLEASSPLLGRIIPSMVDSAFKLALDPIFPPPEGSATGRKVPTCDILPENRFVLVFDEKVDKVQLADYSSHYQQIDIIDEIEDEEASSSGSEAEDKEVQ